MKFMMVFEGVDRATRVMGKIMGAEKKTAAAMKAGARAGQSATDASTRATERLAAALAKVGGAARGAYNAVVAGANAAARATVNLHRQTVALGRAGLGRVKEGAAKASRGVMLAGGAAASAVGAAVLAANQLLGVATKFESYNIQLETLEGSSRKGQQAMAWISDFAARTPLELDQVVEAYRNLKTFGLDPMDGTLLALVDTMAASGKGAEQLEGLTLALGQAWTKGKLQGEEALQLLERGVPVWDILSQKYGKTAAELQELASKGKLGRDAIRLLIDEIGRRHAGASDKMAHTWLGMLSNLSDAWSRFALAVMNAGLFDWMKGKLQMVLDTVNRMAGDGTLQAWAERVSARIIQVLEAAWTFATRTYQILSTLGGYLAVAADTVGGWENLAMILGGLAFGSTLVSTAAGIVQIATGLAMLGAALLANPILLLIAAIVAGAVAIYVYWEPIKAFFADLWNSIAAGAAAAYGWLTDLLGFDPIAALSAGWNAVSDFFASAWAAIPSLSWDSIVSVFTWSNVLTVLDWASWLSPLRWLDFVPGFSWSDIISGALDWAAYVTSLDWSAYLPPLSWDGVLTVLDWASWLSPLRWLDFVPGFSWSGIISGALDWAAYVTSLDWTAFLPPLSWGGVLTVFEWASWLSPLRWLDFVPGFSWSGIISGALDWAAYVSSLDWSAYLPPLSWDGVLAVLNWASWLSPLRWLDFVPGFSWSGIISGALDWGAYVTSLDWSAYIPEFSWPELPAFAWPELPSLTLPELPDIAGWIGAFGDKAYAAMEAVASRLGSAWSGIKSAFTWGDEDATVTVTDPATIQAAAAATAALKADIQAVAAIDTGPALDRLSALESAAQRVGAAVTASIRQAQAFLASVSFYDQGAALMDTMAAGIRARAAVVTAEIAKMAQAVRDHLPSSPAKVGPLSDIHRLKFAETIAASIRPAPMVKAMRSAAAATLAAATLTLPALPVSAIPAVAMPTPPVLGAVLPPAAALPASAVPVATPAPPPSAAATAAQDAPDQGRAVAARADVARASVQGRPAEPSAASPVTLNFSPVLNFKGGTPPSDVKAEFDKMLRDAGREIGRLLDEEMRRRRRSDV